MRKAIYGGGGDMAPDVFNVYTLAVYLEVILSLQNINNCHTHRVVFGNI